MDLQNQSIHPTEDASASQVWTFDRERTNQFFFKKLTYFISAEISDPIAVIDAQIQELESLLGKSNLSSERLAKGLRSIAQSNQKINRITKQLRSLSEAGSPRPRLESVFLRQIISDTLDLCQNRLLQHQFKNFLSVDPKLIISARPSEIMQILMHLIENSIRANMNQKSPWIQIEAFNEGSEAVLHFCDSGSGILEKDTPSVLRPVPFGDKGPLRGLPVSAYLAQENGGSLGLRKNTAITALTLRLPLARSYSV